MRGTLALAALAIVTSPLAAPQSPAPADFSSLLDRQAPAIVSVFAIRELEPEERGDAEAQGIVEELARSLGLAPPESPLVPVERRGTGFVVSGDGYVLTNAHVVHEAAEVTVKLFDRREYPAHIVGTDPPSDIAVLKIDAQGLPVVRFGDPHALRAGQWVATIGAPFGFEYSVTVGVVSGLGRTLAEHDATPLIQLDVAVNPGNSGGPLFNVDGDVVGSISQIVSRSGGYEGISFAVPIDVALEVRDEIVRTGQVVRGRIGVMVQEVDAPLARHLGLDSARGALVNSVERGGPADVAGIVAGDVILAIANEPIERPAQLYRRVARLPPGREVTVELWRDRARRSIELRVGATPAIPTKTTRPRATPESARDPAGLEVRVLSPDERREMQTSARLVVTDVSGAAARAGLIAGDLLLTLDAAPVESEAQLRGAIARAGRVAGLLIERDGERLYLPITLGAVRER